MAQTANALLDFEASNRLLNSVPIKASTEIFLGAAVGMTSGYARQLVAGDTFAGFAEQHVNNTVATDGAARMPVLARGQVKLSVTSVAVTDIGADVYASDSQTFVLAAGPGNTFIGKVLRFVSSGVAIVAFDTTNP